MRIVLTLLFAVWLTITPAWGAATDQAVEQNEVRLLWSSEPERPAWIFATPEGLQFVGLSSPLADEAAARKDALHYSIEQVVLYAHEELQKRLFASRQKSSRIKAEDNYRLAQKLDVPLALALIDQVKPLKWYQERLQTGTRITEHAFVLVEADKDFLETYLERVRVELAEEAKWEYQEFLERQKQKQKQFWEEMQKQGGLVIE